MDATSQEIIDRSRNARFEGEFFDVCKSGEIEYSAKGNNPLCGDSLTVAVRISRKGAGPAGQCGNSHFGEGAAVIEDARFRGYGCSLCLATADALLEHVLGKPVEHAASLSFDDVSALWDGGLEVGRSRRACVMLSLTVLKDALRQVRCE